MLSTAWSKRAGLRVPVLNAPMGGVAGGRLAAAVTAAGGLGMIGVGSTGSAQALIEQLGRFEAAAIAEPVGRAPRFGIGVVDWVVHRQPDLLDTALAAHPQLLSVSFGTEMSWVQRAQAAGVRTATQVYSGEDARRAQDAGVDVLVARGAEGGGHGEATLATLPLLDEVLAVATVPILAAGGIASARSLAAVLAAGASGVWLGTCLSVCPEALTPPAVREVVIGAASGDTMPTRVFDIAQGFSWPARFPARVVRNEFVRRWAGCEEALADDDVAQAALAGGIAAGDPEVMPVDAGQGVGLVNESRPVADVIDELCTGARQLLNAWGEVAGE